MAQPEDGDDEEALLRALTALRPAAAQASTRVCMAAPGRHRSIEIQLGGDTVRVEPTTEAVEDLLGLAWLVGGYEQVQDIHAALVALEREALRALQSQYADAAAPAAQRASQFSGGVAPDQGRSADEWQALASLTGFILGTYERAWEALAQAEEAVLVQYEAEGLAEISRRLDESVAIAESEWLRYAPVRTGTNANRVTMDQAAGGLVPLANLVLSQEVAPLRQAVRTLVAAWDAATQRQAQHAQARRYLKQRPSFQSRFDRRLARQALPETEQLIQQALSEALEAAARSFPAALLVYRDLGRGHTDADIDASVIAALLQSKASARELAGRFAAAKLMERRWLAPAEAPAPEHGSAAPDPSAPPRALARPASLRLAQFLATPSDTARYSVFTDPLVHRLLHAKGQAGMPALEPFTRPGSLHFTALNELLAGLQTQRQLAADNAARTLLLVGLAGLLLAPASGNASLVVAGALDVPRVAGSLWNGVLDHQARLLRARASVTPLLALVWTCPSTEALVRQLLRDGLDLAADLLNTGLMAKLLTGMQVAIAVRFGAAELDALLDPRTAGQEP